MKIKRILLTGDDGYNAIGIRLVAHYFKNTYELAIAATLKQQSGVGGHLSLRAGGTWGESTVDGIPAFWTDGYPADVIECAQGYFKKPFDLVISGINLGANVGGGSSSGTVAAAIRAVELQLAPRAIMLSWDLPGSYWYHEHDGKEDLTPYLKHPGETMSKVVKLAIAKSLWGAKLLNVNFSAQESDLVRFTRPIEDLTKYYIYPLYLDPTTKIFSYDKPVESSGKSNIMTRAQTKGDLTLDTGAMLAGYTSISPLNANMLNEKIYKKLEKEEITL